MRRSLACVAVLLAAASLPLSAQTFSFGTGDATLDVTLNSINVQATANIGPYTAELSASFGVGQPQIQAWLTVDKMEPAEVYLALELGKLSGKPPATVVTLYKQNKGKGWGAVAKALGIKPGSAAFKALKTNASDRNQKLKAKKGK